MDKQSPMEDLNTSYSTAERINRKIKLERIEK